ncbi:hypothetical protein [Parvularcula sp. LCG005]|uniref:hypothetical protein n=1 Tax=Parvularcula sp. LCG005 TaxID=3078805 RepID=UPI0029427937|nr:hypothetical protein [Parvularcula sp. LCG005]WOI52382.1 hypothetical protein RUI03_09480 [Parvularcula sp. LCG005]
MERAKMYGLGFVVLMVGLVWLAFTLGAPPLFIAIGVLIVGGLGIMSAAVKTKRASSVRIDS